MSPIDCFDNARQINRRGRPHISKVDIFVPAGTVAGLPILPAAAHDLLKSGPGGFSGLCPNGAGNGAQLALWRMAKHRGNNRPKSVI
jgi:hypothetical protein